MPLTHIDANGNAVMVDVGEKAVTSRTAVAAGRIRMSPACFDIVKNGEARKGDVLGVAQVAGIMATKHTSELIPLCHTLLLTKSAVEFTLFEASCEIEARCTVHCDGKTGVEMEALTAVTVAALAIVDMVKGVDRSAAIADCRIVAKSGGRSGDWKRP